MITEFNDDLTVQFDWTALDAVGVEIHMSTTQGFYPDGTTLLLRDGTRSNDITIVGALSAGPDTYYIRVGAFDRWGLDDIIYSAEETIITVAVLGMLYDAFLAQSVAQDEARVPVRMSDARLRMELQLIHRVLLKLKASSFDPPL